MQNKLTEADPRNEANRVLSRRCKRSGRPRVDRLESRVCLSATFSAPTFFTGVDSTTGIAAGDFNGDGKTDIAVAGVNPGSSAAVVGVYLNQNGTFGTPTLLPISGSSSGIATGDFLGNGRQDVAVVDSSSNRLDVFLNDGAGDFSQGAGASLGGTSGDTSIATADFNGDNKDDVAVVDPAHNSVVVETSNGDGSFTLKQSVAVPSPLKVIAADFDSSHHPDLAILSGNGSVYVALNDGSGNFSPAVRYGLGANLTSPTALAAGVFTASGQSDLIGVGPGGGGADLGLLVSQSDGTFAPAADVALPVTPDLAFAGDFTTSGVTDLGLLTSGGGLVIIPGNGNGTFASPQSIFSTSLGSPATQAVVGNFAGEPGIAFLSSSQGGFGVTNETGAGTASSSDLSAALSGSGPASAVAGLPLNFKEKLVLTASTGAVSGAASATMLLSPDQSAADSVLTLASAGEKLKLKSGAAKTLSLKFPKSLPSTLAPGTYHLLIHLTDTAGVVSTLDSGQTLTVVAPAVDLSGTFVKTPLTAKAGKPLSVTLLITNSSAANVSAVGLLPLDLETSPDGLTSDAVPLLSETRQIRIKPGKSITLTLKATLGASDFLVVRLDPGNTAFPDDVNRANNTFATANAISIQ